MEQEVTIEALLVLPVHYKWQMGMYMYIQLPTWQNSSFTCNFPQFWIENSSFTCNFPQFCHVGDIFCEKNTLLRTQQILSLHLCIIKMPFIIGIQFLDGLCEDIMDSLAWL